MSEPPAPPAPTDQLDERTRWRAFAVCVAVAALTILDLSKVNVALPSIERALDASSGQLQAIVAGYALAFGLVLVPFGRLGDLRSRRLLFLIGVTAFTVTSLLCAIAPNIVFLMVARFLQGVAAGVQMPQVLGLIQQLFQGPARGRAFGVFGAVVGVSTAFGPTLGGLLIAVGGAADGWRLIFWMNIPLGVILFIVAWRLLPRRAPAHSAVAGLDPVGVTLLGLTVAALMVPFLLTTGTSSDRPERWLLIVAAVAFGAGFVAWEQRYRRRGRTPAVDFSLFRLASYRNGILIAAVYFAAIPGTFLLITLYLQEGLQLEPVYAGMVTIPFALSAAVSAWLGGTLVERMGRSLVVIGLAVVVTGFTLTTVLAVVTPPEVTPFAMAGAMLVAGAGGGFVISPNQTLTLAEVPVADGGVAGSVGQVAQRVGTAIGVACTTAVFYATLAGERGARIDVYHDGFRNGLTVAIALIAGALVLALLDLRQRHHARLGSAAEGASASV